MDKKAKSIVREYILEHLDKSEETPEFEVFTVWKAKILQNWKYLLSSTLPDGMYYELTFNGDRDEWYLDAYKKMENRVLSGKPRIPEPGERFERGGITFVALGEEQGGILAVTERAICRREFDEEGSNDWRKSSLRKYLREDFLEQIGKEDLLPFTTDLTSDDGLKDYGSAEDYAFLLSADLYRKYRAYIPEQDEWWWLLTPWTTHPSCARGVRNVLTDGTLRSGNANFTYGVVAGLLFNPKSFTERKRGAPARGGAE